MSQFRADQVQTLARLQPRHFLPEIVAHLHDFATTQCGLMSAEALTALVDNGLARSVHHGFDHRGSARFFLECMFMFGSHFDTDPQYVVFNQALRERGEAVMLDRADRMHKAVMAYINAASGPNHDHEHAALVRMATARFEGVMSLGDRRDDIVEVLDRVYPEKCRYLGKDAMANLVDVGFSLASRRGSVWTSSGALITGLMFTFGHGCFEDPQFPWIGAALSRSGTSTLDDGAPERLFSRFMTYLGLARERFEARATGPAS